MEELYPCHKKQTKNLAETTEIRYPIEILMRRMRKLKGLAAASLILQTLNDNPYITNIETKENTYPVNEKTSSLKDVLYVGFYKTLRL